MPSNHQIKQTVQFTEQTVISKEQSENVLLDIWQEEVTNNIQYCQCLLDQILKLPYAQLPDFFAHHANFTFFLIPNSR